LSHRKDALDALRAVSKQPQKMDKLSAFCKSIAGQMQKLLEEDTIDLMSEIQDLIAKKQQRFISYLKQWLVTSNCPCSSCSIQSSMSAQCWNVSVNPDSEVTSVAIVMAVYNALNKEPRET
jgi:hypothetical protein